MCFFAAFGFKSGEKNVVVSSQVNASLLTATRARAAHKKMHPISTQLLCILSSALLYFGCFYLNNAFFGMLEFSTGVNWIFLPAGLRLLCTLLFAEAGVIGIFIASLAVTFLTLPSVDGVTGFGAACISGGAPYLTYRLAQARGLNPSLQQLTAARLSVLIVMYALTSSLLHQIWFTLRGVSANLITGFGAMFIGDLLGTLIVIYVMKMVLAIARRPAKSLSK